MCLSLRAAKFNQSKTKIHCALNPRRFSSSCHYVIYYHSITEAFISRHLLHIISKILLSLTKRHILIVFGMRKGCNMTWILLVLSFICPNGPVFPDQNGLLVFHLWLCCLFYPRSVIHTNKARHNGTCLHGAQSFHFLVFPSKGYGFLQILNVTSVMLLKLTGEIEKIK